MDLLRFKKNRPYFKGDFVSPSPKQYKAIEMNVIKFSTEAEAEARQAQCHLDWLVDNPEVNGYISIRWATPRQRSDGDWTIPECPCSDHSGDTLIPYDEADYPQGEV